MKPGNLLLIHSMSSDIFNQFFSATVFLKALVPHKPRQESPLFLTDLLFQRASFLPFTLPHHMKGITSFQYHLPFKYLSQI